jgi:hypothetical protein
MAYKTIKIKGDPMHLELVAAAAITPGHLCEVDSAGKLAVHSTAGGTAAPIFAFEDENQGNEIGTAYTASNQAVALVCSPGCEVFAILANGENAAIGNFLESQGDGTLRVVDADASVGDVGVQSVVGVAMEAVDMSGSSGVDPSGRIRVMVI